MGKVQSYLEIPSQQLIQTGASQPTSSQNSSKRSMKKKFRKSQINDIPSEMLISHNTIDSLTQNGKI